MGIGMMLAEILLSTGAGATPIVTFYNDRTTFLAAISGSTVHNFEGIVSDTGVQDFGTYYHTGQVTFTSPSPPFGNHVFVAGKNSETLGAPFDSAILIPDSEPSSIIATFDPDSHVTAVGGYFLNLFGNNQSSGGFKLTGASGLLDQRSVPLGIATTGKPKTFLGYTVVGDTISSLSLNSGTNAPVFDDFTYGTAIPEPRCLIWIFILGSTLVRTRSHGASRSIFQVLSR